MRTIKTKPSTLTASHDQPRSHSINTYGASVKAPHFYSLHDAPVSRSSGDPRTGRAGVQSPKGRCWLQSGWLLGHEGTDLFSCQRTEPQNAAEKSTDLGNFCCFNSQMIPEQLTTGKWIPERHRSRDPLGRKINLFAETLGIKRENNNMRS